MEIVQQTANDAERLRSTLFEGFPPELVNFLFSSRLEKDGYETLPTLTSSEAYQVLANEKWNSGKRELVGYSDGTVTLKLQERDTHVDVCIVLARDGRVQLDGILPFFFLIDTLRARQKGLLSDQNLITPYSIIESLNILKFVNPQKAVETKGVRCSLESDSQGKLLIKGVYLT